MYKLQIDITPQFARESINMPNAFEGSTEIKQSKLENRQYGFHQGRSTTDQIFTLKQTFKKSS